MVNFLSKARNSFALCCVITLSACGGGGGGGVPDADIDININDPSSGTENTVPEVSNVRVTYANGGSEVSLGDAVSVSYVYSDIDSDPEGQSIVSWFRNGEVIVGASSSIYIITEADLGQSLYAEVTPVAQSGELLGSPEGSQIFSVSNNDVDDLPGDEEPNENVKPVANAGSDVTVEVGQMVYLDATSSFDPDGSIVRYRWNNGLDGANPAPISYSAPGNYLIELSVEDNLGAVSYDVVTINVSEIITVPNQAPVFTCLEDFSVGINEVFTLTTQGAYDPDGTIASINWSLGGGANGASGASGESVTHALANAGAHNFSVLLTDNDGASTQCGFTVTAIADKVIPPVANAGEDIQVRVDESFQLNGTASTSQNGPLTYSWDVGLTGANPTYMFSAAGTYEIVLTVTDADNVSATDSVRVSVTDPIYPIVGPIDPITVCAGDTVDLNASNSYDEDGTIVSYSWAGADVSLSGERVNFTPLDPGSFDLTLTIVDDEGLSASDIISITVEDCSSTIVYVSNLYNAPNIHYFNVSPIEDNTAWPGLPMDYDEELELHYFEFSTDVESAGIVFNAGEGQAQTEDLTFTAGENNCFDGGSNTWQTVEQCTSDEVGTITPIDFASRTAFVHLFEWQWDDIASECENYLGPKGYAAVQVSPPQKSIEGGAWWTRYQPVSYSIEGRSGNRDQFQSMVTRCKAVGVDIYVDAVINHMAAWDRNFPEVPYSGNDFHDCGTAINYQDRGSIQFCDLSALNDLKTESDNVREKIAEYMNDMISLGVAGFRIDAAKHIPSEDIANIVGRLNGNPYIFQEVIGAPGEPITPQEYTYIGDVTEFRFTDTIGHYFKMRGALRDLGGLGDGWNGWLNSNDAIVFVANHDNQRQNTYDTITHKDGWEVNNIAHIYMLAWPYGYPKVMSSYDWNDHDQGPPWHGASNCDNGWLCEHRNREIANMVGFRNFTNGEGVQNWWDNGSNQIAFSRGDKGFVVINGENGGTLSTTLQTGMPEGTYCDVINADMIDGACSGATITVDASGNASFNVNSKRASAIHVGSRVE